jgi:hypothetical protein
MIEMIEEVGFDEIVFLQVHRSLFFIIFGTWFSAGRMANFLKHIHPGSVPMFKKK